MKAEKERNEQTLANLQAEREEELKSLREERERGEEVSLSPMLRKRAEPRGYWEGVLRKLGIVFVSRLPN